MIEELLSALLRGVDEFGKVALATVIETKGATPRKAGAKMVVYPDGRTFGTIGGGCGEAEVVREARNVLDLGRSAVLSVDMTADVAASEGMVCGGVMRVFVELVQS